MSKTPSQTPAITSFLEYEIETGDTFFFKVQSDHIIERANDLTSLGYDNEIGLWEEQEHRNKR